MSPRVPQVSEIEPSPTAPGVTHATSPLSAVEMQAAVDIVKAEYGEALGDVRFEIIRLEEPCKKKLRAGIAVPREARVNACASLASHSPALCRSISCSQPSSPPHPAHPLTAPRVRAPADKGNKNWGVTPGVYTGVVNLDTGSVTTWDYLPDAMPMRGGSSWMATMKLAKEDPRIIEALARRGITDVDKVVMEPWPTGPTAKTFENAPFDYSETDPVWKDELGKYTAYIHMWLREDSDLDNYYAHPIDGLKAVVDIGGMEILSVEDTDDSIPVPMELNNYAKQYLPEENPKVPPKPIEILQPDGATFTVDEGNKLEWMGWDLTIGFNAREGLTLHSIGFTEPGTTERRSICYRASVAEMVVPYGSPNRGLWRKSVFDTGEAGLGKAVNALELGCDCLGNIHYLDVPMVEEDGSVDVKKNAICIHEEDDGILWKHKGSSKCNGRLGP